MLIIMLSLILCVLFNVYLILIQKIRIKYRDFFLFHFTREQTINYIMFKFAWIFEDK